MLSKFSNSQIYFISFVVSGLSTFIATSLYARLLTTNEFGIYALGLSVFTLLNSFFFQWNKLSLLRHIDGTNDEKVFINAIAIYITLTVTVSTLFFVISYFEFINFFTVQVFIYLITFSFFDLLLSYYRAALKATLFLYLSLLKSVLSIVVAYILLSLVEPTSDNLFISISISLLISCLIVIFIHNIVSLNKRKSFLLFFKSIDFLEVKKQVAFGFPLTISLLCTNSIYSLSRIIGATLLSVSIIGVFSAYYTVIQQIIFTLAMACNSYGYTKLVRDYKCSTEAANITLQKNLIMILNFIFPAFIVIFSNSKLIFEIYFPIDYHNFDHKLIFLIFITVGIFSIKSYYLEHIYHLESKTKQLFKYSAISLGVCLIVVYPLTSIFNEFGLVVSILLSYTVNSLLLVINSKKLTNKSLKVNGYTMLYIIFSLSAVIILQQFKVNDLKLIFLSLLVGISFHIIGWFIYFKRIK